MPAQCISDDWWQTLFDEAFGLLFKCHMTIFTLLEQIVAVLSAALLRLHSDATSVVDPVEEFGRPNSARQYSA